MTEQEEEASIEQRQEEARLKLAELLQLYEIDAASHRRSRDALVAAWHDILKDAIFENTRVDWPRVHMVLDTMEEFLKRRR